jgi:Na+-translocating ferredoxin:NAD+ oxidoreductase RnfG subunit
MKIPQMLLGAIALSVGITIAAANSDAEQYAKKCVLPYPTVDNDTSKQQTKTAPNKLELSKTAKQKNVSQKTVPIHKKEVQPKSEKPKELIPASVGNCPACGMG